MNTPQWGSSVVPARLSFLAIYNPSLGPSDDTFAQQLVFHYSRAVHEAHVVAKRYGRRENAGGDAARAEENERLRQIGLAQGLVDFARTFSNNQSVDSIETEKSRIVLQELENGWWILASIDLTQLPAIPHRTTEKHSSSKSEGALVDYSAREVSPPSLLHAQLRQAHDIFGLHHGLSLDDLFVRLARDKFCSILDRYWVRFARTWNVLLHGNPAVDVFNGIKLASGGELGFGVGEEEWGSGEREVLEGLARHTEGLVDMVVSRFGGPDLQANDGSFLQTDHDVPSWMGGGREAAASDGVIFGGIGAISRCSLRSVSLWMRHIYTYGHHAYGIRDNPLRTQRKTRRRQGARDEEGKTAVEESRDSSASEPSAAKVPHRPRRQKNSDSKANDPKVDKKPASYLALLPSDKRPQIHPRVASQDYATTPEQTPTPPPDAGRIIVPPPIVSAAEEALQKATAKIDRKPKSDANDAEAEGTTLGIPDTYMKYLTFGLSTLAKKPIDLSAAAGVPSTASSDLVKNATGSAKAALSRHESERSQADGDLTQLDPIPDGEPIKSKLAAQRSQENEGYFLIGLTGDLYAKSDETDEVAAGNDLLSEGEGSRTLLRTLHVQTVSEPDPKAVDEPQEQGLASPQSDDQPGRRDYFVHRSKRLRVLVYVRRPFMYCFLFNDRTSSLQWENFYRSLHESLIPIHKPLLSSTSAVKVNERIELSQAQIVEEDQRSGSSSTSKPPTKSSNTSPIFSFISNPHLLTLHTSLPNIPEPGTFAAEGIPLTSEIESTYPPSWTRVDALNVHSQILETLACVSSDSHQVERTSKTSRGWWVVWMKLPVTLPGGEGGGGSVDADDVDSVKTLTANDPATSSELDPSTAREHDGPDLYRTAFLVRKASESLTSPQQPTTSSLAVSSMLSVMTLGLGGRSEDHETGGSSAGWGPGALTDGIGVDPRKYIESLLSLNR